MSVADKRAARRAAPTFPKLWPGQRVRLRPPLIEVDLASPLATIAREGDYDGYYVLRLDEPARYYPLGQATSTEFELIDELVENSDNLDIWEDGRWRQPAWVKKPRRSP
jgi:hypothetical protein